MKGVQAFFTGIGLYLLSAGVFSFLQISRARRLSSFHDIELRLFIALLFGTALAWTALAAARKILSRGTGKGGGIKSSSNPAGALRILFEERGPLLFLVSLFSYSQLAWARTHGYYGDLGIRLLMAFLAGALLARGLRSLLRATSPDHSSCAAAWRKLSLSLSPGILFIFASAEISFLALTPILCMAAAFAADLLTRPRRPSEISGPLFPLLLAILLALGLFLRLWGLDYPRDHPDGAKQVTAAMRFVYGDYTFSLGHPKSDVSGYPYYAMHLVELSYRACDAVLRHLYPHHDPPRAVKSAGGVTFKTFLRNLARWLNVLYQSASIVLLYLVGRQLFGPVAGLFAAGLMTFSTLQIQMTHVVNADIPSAFFALASMYLAVRVRDGETPLGYLAAGVAAGLSAASKYHGIFALFFIFLVFLEWRWRKGDWREAPWRSAAAALWTPLGFAAAFLLATPSLFLDGSATLAAIADYRGTMSGYNVPAEYVNRRAALFFHQLPNHANNFLRFFEPLPGWAAIGALILFWVRRGRREALLWVYPLVLFPLGSYAHNTSVSYHYLGVFIPFYWITGYAAAKVLGAIKLRSLRVAALLLFFLPLFLGALSDTSLFALPPARDLAEAWHQSTGAPERFTLVKSKAEDRYPKIFGIDFAGFFSGEEDPAPFNRVPVAVFDMERRSPTLNNCRNRPAHIFWGNDLERPLDLLPLPRRTVEEQVALLFPENSVLSRDPGLFRLRPGTPFIRRIRFAGPSRWLIFAHYSSLDPAGDPAILEVKTPGSRRRFKVEKDSDLLETLDLNQPDLLYNRLFATVKTLSDQPLAVWLVSPRERGWFYLMTERWNELEEWERGKEDRASRLRRAVALNHLGGGRGEDTDFLEEVEPLLKDFQSEDVTKLFRDPTPSLPLYRFAIQGDRDKTHWPELRPGNSLYGPYATLVPGFYSAIYALSCPPGGARLEYRVTSEMGRSLLVRGETILPKGVTEVTVPFRVTSAHPGWDAEFLLMNQGGETVRIEAVRVENDVEGLFNWWATEVRSALGPR